MSIKDLGIDLGTSNCAIAYVESESGDIKQVEITQVASPGAMISKSTMASALYSPREGEVLESDLNLPWTKTPQQHAVGFWALEHGSLNPDRVIVSAKSWLCFDQIARDEPILPWGSEDASIKRSPIDASKAYLSHLLSALRYELDQRLSESFHTVLTVPASFDEVARKLTLQAAKDAGLDQITLIEEPLAAFYAWIANDTEHWRDQLSAGDLVLVCDVGGGTTDFSLISVMEDTKGLLQLERIAVGKHLLLGGDNMDLALAFALKMKLEAKGHSVDDWQMQSLRLAARSAKEQLLSHPEEQSYPISIASRGSSLFETSLSTELDRAMLDAIITEGFFPSCGATAQPKAASLEGLQEFGLPYENDPSITVHLASFLQKAYRNSQSDDRLKALTVEHCDHDQKTLRPNKVLFNGGVFKAQSLQHRLVEVIKTWGLDDLDVLTGADLELSVSKGAAYYASVKRKGEGLKIRSGTARSYYLGVESSMMAIPGFTPPVKGICIIPQGSEPGQYLRLTSKEFGLITGKSAEFKLYSSSERAGDTIGLEVPDAEKHLDQAANLTLALPLADGKTTPERIPVVLDAHINEIGTMQLSMKHKHSDEHWNLEFDIRAHD